MKVLDACIAITTEIMTSAGGGLCTRSIRHVNGKAENIPFGLDKLLVSETDW